MMTAFNTKKPELAIDFGTANLRLIRRDEGIVFDEPSLCCFDVSNNVLSLNAAGSAVRSMIDRTPHRLSVRRPLHRGVLQDIAAATHLLRYAVEKTSGRWRLNKTSAVMGVPIDATEAERGALLTAARDAGLGPIHLVSESFAAAIGAELPVDKPTGTMIVECGAGTTEIAVISLGGVCTTRSVRVGGASLNQAIADHLHFQHKFLVGELTVERIKEEYSARRQESSCDSDALSVKGRSLTTRMPAILEMKLSELDGVVQRHMAQIVQTVREVLNETAPELSQDICSHGVFLTGGSAKTPGLSEMIMHETGLAVTIAENPLSCVAQGLQRILQS